MWYGTWIHIWPFHHAAFSIRIEPRKSHATKNEWTTTTTKTDKKIDYTLGWLCDIESCYAHSIQIVKYVRTFAFISIIVVVVQRPIFRMGSIAVVFFSYALDDGVYLSVDYIKLRISWVRFALFRFCINFFFLFDRCARHATGLRIEMSE